MRVRTVTGRSCYRDPRNSSLVTTSKMVGRDQYCFFTAVLLVTFTAICFPLVYGQSTQIGVSLKVQGVTIPNNSFVHIDDLLYRAHRAPQPTNANGLHEQTLLCITDLIDCCEAPRTVRGNWYYPDGRTVTLSYGGLTRFQSNRGTNEIINGQQFFGSVRLYRQWSPTERGRFRCELPSAANPSISQVLYANIVDNNYFGPVSMSRSGSGIAGETFSLVCSVTLRTVPLPSNAPAPTFKWLYGSNSMSEELPSGVTPMQTVQGSGNTYISTLQFSLLNQSYSGIYTCRLGAGRLANNTTVSVIVPTISVRITTAGLPIVGEHAYSLTCIANGAENIIPSVTYHWFKNYGTQTQLQVGFPANTLFFSNLSLSDAGRYTCLATISSPYLDDDITATGSHDFRVYFSSAPDSVMLSSNTSSPIHSASIGSAITLICTVKLNPLLNVAVNVATMWTGPAGFTMTNTAQPVNGSTTTYISSATVSSFGRGQSGVYSCTATASSSSPFFIDNLGSQSQTARARVTVGVYLFFKGVPYANNSVIQITEIGDTILNEGLQCITDKMPCCETPPNRVGEWYFPDGMRVPMQSVGATSFYRNRRDNGAIGLHRINSNVITPTGRFCCEVPDAIDALQTVCATIISVQITGSMTTPTIGRSLTLTCGTSGTEGLNITNYHWKKDGILLSDEVGPTLSFAFLRLSDVGQYTCEVTINNNVMKYSDTEDINLTIPPPTSVMITSSPASLIRPVGADVTLICTVELSTMVNIPVTVTTVWTGPAGFTSSNTAQSVMGSTTTYTSTAMVSSFGRDESGIYTCSATISSVSSFLIESMTTSSAEVTVGVYLLFNKTVYANNSIIQIAKLVDMGLDIAHNQGLQCITDRKPCCRNTGEWLFPNGTLVPTEDSARSFYKSSGDNGNVSLNLLRTNSVLPLLTGMFCCILPDANSIVDAVCVEINLTIYAEIGNTGISTAGKDYTLTCNVSGLEKFSSIVSYKWIKNNGTEIQVGFNSNTLSFSPLRLSDAGLYTCHVSVSSDDASRIHAANTSSQPFEVNVNVPEPTVSLHSDSLDPSLSDSVLTLICTVELNAAVDVPVTIRVAWNGPDGTEIASTAPEMKTHTLYISSSTLHSIELADSGNYTCTVGIENGAEVSTNASIKIVDKFFQLRLRSIDICQQLYSKDSKESEEFIMAALVKVIEHQCKCHFPITNLFERGIFICEDSPNLMTYRNVLLGTYNFNGTRIIGFIQDWVDTGPLIKIRESHVRVDSSCPVAISSLNEPGCGQTEVGYYTDKG